MQLIYRVTSAIETWSDGYFRDDTGWYPCHNTCKTWIQADKWDTCEDFMALDAATGLCSMCNGGQYMDTVLGICRDWQGSWETSCSYQLSCFECEADQFLDLDTLDCLTSCDTPKVLLNDPQFSLANIWRGLNFYIDPDSTEVMEFGTQQYPYRNFRSAASEILNHYSLTDVDVTILLKENTRVYIEEDTTYFIRMNLVTIKSYSDFSSDPGRALIVQTSITQPEMSGKAVFHILQHTNLDTRNQITLGGYSDDSKAKFAATRRIFKVIETNFTFSNINAYSEEVDYNSETYFIFPYLLQNRNVTIGKWHD